jgi:hypothetical protein
MQRTWRPSLTRGSVPLRPHSRTVEVGIVVLVDGLNGSTHPVATVGLVADEDRPRLVSSWVDIP